MKRQQAEIASAVLNKVTGDLTEVSALLKRGVPLPPAMASITAEVLDKALTELAAVQHVLADEVAALAQHAKNYRVEIRYEGREPGRSAYSNPDTARGNARRAFEAGATVARVRRVTDDVVIYDGPAGVDLDFKEW